jgi:hypothetical protein
MSAICLLPSCNLLKTNAKRALNAERTVHTTPRFRRPHQLPHSLHLHSPPPHPPPLALEGLDLGVAAWRRGGVAGLGLEEDADQSTYMHTTRYIEEQRWDSWRDKYEDMTMVDSPHVL